MANARQGSQELVPPTYVERHTEAMPSNKALQALSRKDQERNEVRNN